MALPRLNSGPKYQLTIPSSNQDISYRPFLMKEEKELLIAMETKDNKTILNSLLSTIKACVEDQSKLNRLTPFDVEYMFLQIRSKSVGETTTIGLNCKECETLNSVDVKLDDINVTVPKIDKILKLDDQVELEVDYPTFTDIINSGMTEQTTEPSTEQLFKLIEFCFKSIITNDEKIILSEVPKSELHDFVDSMSGKQFSKIRNFIENIPKLSHEIKFECSKCKTENEQTVEGINNFLS
tara:strand:+ start:1162 stop:1878 length:717 start_codon:yes stop_codon:yes gene_type:complete